MKETGDSAGSNEPARVVRFRKLAFPVAEAGATWQVANVSAMVRVMTPGGGGCEHVVVGRKHTHTHTLLSFFSRVGDPGRFLFCPPFLSLPLIREDAIKQSFALISFCPFQVTR